MRRQLASFLCALATIPAGLMSAQAGNFSYWGFPSQVSSTKTTSNSTNSYVDLEVDWSRNLAYLPSRKAGICVEVVDFSNPLAPTVVKTIGSGSLNTCLGAKLFDNNTKLLLSSSGSNKLAVWDLTSTPTNYASWYSMGEYNIGDKGKRIAGIVDVSANNWTAYAAQNQGAFSVSISVSGAVATITLLNSYTDSHFYNSATLLGNRILLQSYDGSTDPILRLNTSMVQQTSDAMLFYNWTAVTNAAGDKAYVGGGDPWGGAFYGVSSGIVSLKKKFADSTGTCLIRSADFAVQGASEYLYALCSNGTIFIYDVTTIANPTLIKITKLMTFEMEAYGIKVKPNSNTAIAVSNKGDFNVLDLRGLRATGLAFTEDPITYSNSASYTTPGSTTFTVPAGVTTLQVSVLGAGGGGSWGESNNGGGGGSGGFTRSTLTVAPGEVYDVVVGAGGNGGPLGGGGGASSFGTSLLLACGGGAGGKTGVNQHTNGPSGGGSCGGAGGNGGIVLGDGGQGGGYSGGTGFNGSTGGQGSDSGGGGGGAGAPGKTGPGTNGDNYSGNQGGNGGMSSAGLAGGLGTTVRCPSAASGASGAIPEGGSGGGGGWGDGSCGGSGGTGGKGAGGGAGYDGGGPGGDGWVYVEY